ncbi:hypothetical protein Btru_005213 [Bulinus truncatus]|nr:hypothetical protein Btru_005213 [Bulinus truncatus]
MVQKADVIYRSSVFPFVNNINFKNIGLYVKTLVLYDSYTISVNPYSERYIHFNVDGKDWTADDKLDSFSYYMKFFRPKLCLSHLVTAFPFPFSVLGLAFTDTLCKGIVSVTDTLCKAGYDERDVINTAVTSTLNTRNEPVSSLEMLIAFAHGHNFGSPHDPDVPECFPLDSEGGTYIMWSVGSSGKHPNNFRFSPCSLKEIGIRLAKTDCLAEHFDQSLCGNGLIEENEQCDPGLDGRDDDPCCTKECYLRIGAVCSGQCYNGVCVSYCEAKGVQENVNLKSCLCRTPENACKWCCFNDSAPEYLKMCKPHSKGYVLDGRRCYMGYCEEYNDIQDLDIPVVKVCPPVQMSEIVNKLEIGESSYVKRDSNGQELIKNLRFKFLNRNFFITLKSGTTVLSKDFKAYLVEEDGTMAEFFFDQSQVYSGHLYGNPSVFVNAHKEEDLWSLQILEENDTYAVEPIRNLLKPSENLYNHTMFAYRASDLIDEGAKCGVKNLPVPNGGHYYKYTENISSSVFSQKRNHSRKPRYNKDYANTCLINVVGDYDLFKKRCNKNFVTCSSLMVSFVNFADNIYKSSDFLDGSERVVGSIRVQIARLELYQSYTLNDVNSIHPHFNAVDKTWDSDTKLAAFGFTMSYMKPLYCHSHLFTQYPMAERVLGLSYISAACHDTFPGRMKYSCGFSSGEDSNTGEITSLQMNLVFVHGHNLGSEHDPETSECSHPDEEGGDFIMWIRAVSGKQANHKKFSPCSLRHIGTSLNTFSCLVDFSKHNKFCGNGIVDEGEQCDAGARNYVAEEPCCNEKCQLNPGAICSDTNTQCCVNCKMAPNTTVCSDHGTVDCKYRSHCTGQSYVCPEGKPVEDWTPCRDGGLCYKGECKGFCEMKSIIDDVALSPCFCRDAQHACKWCCYNVSNPEKPGKCEPYNNMTVKNGRPCYGGFCEQGLCKPHLTSSIKRIAAFLKTIRVSALVKFMRTNIVSTVILLSLILWTPCVLVIKSWDREEREEREITEFLRRSIYVSQDMHYRSEI